MFRYIGSCPRKQGRTRAARDSNISWSGSTSLIRPGDSFRNSIRIAGFAYRSTLRSRTIECASTRRARTTNRRRISRASAASPGVRLFFPDLDRLDFLPFLLSCTKKLLTANRITDAEHGNGVVVLLAIGEKADWLGRVDRAGARQIEV